MLQTSTLLKVASTAIDVHSEDPDQFGWPDQRGGVFTFKSAYEHAVGGNGEGTWVGWKLIWHLNVQQHVRDFIWLLTHGRIPTNHSRWRRGIAINSDY